MSESLSARLHEIEKVLLDERDALRRLDTQGIETAAARKLLLVEAIADPANRAAASDDDKALLVRIRELAAANQILLVHARTCIRGAIEAVTGRSFEQYPRPRPSTTVASMSSLRMNVRG